jgi:tetratricopeptide (TPR) repeat protein
VSAASRRASPILALAVAAAAILAHAPAISNGFVNWDDARYITGNPMVGSVTWEGVRWAFTTFHENNWHPLTWLSHMIDGALFGASPAGHHAMSVALHAANAALLFLVLARMTGKVAPSVLVAALFAVHPLGVESVAWASERKNVLSTLFWILTIGAYALYAERPSRARYAAVIALFALGLMAKPMLVTLPFVLLLLDYWPLRRARRADIGSGAIDAALAIGPTHVAAKATLSMRALIIEKMPLVALSLASCIVTMIAQRPARVSMTLMPLPARLANASVSYVRYLANAVAPVDLAPYHSLPGTAEAPPIAWPLAAGALLTILALTSLAWILRGRAPHVTVGWLWYLGTLVPVIGLVQVGSQAIADRYAYVPLIGIFIAVAWSLPLERPAAARSDAAEVADRDALATTTFPRRAPANALVVPAAALAVLCALGVATARQTRVWRDSESLWGRVLEHNPRSRFALTNLGVHFVDAGRTDEGVSALSRAVAIDSSYALARRGLGVALNAAGRQAEAIAHHEAAIALDPRDGGARYNLANALADLGRLDEAIVRYREAAAADTAAAIHVNLALALVRRGDIDEAMSAAQEGVRLAPDNATAHYAFGLALSRRGDLSDAVREHGEAIRLSPAFVEAHRERSLLLVALGSPREAIAALRDGLRAEPGHAEMSNALAWLLATAADPFLRNGVEAVGLAEHVVGITGRRDPEALDTLGAAYAEVGRFADATRAAAEAAALARSAGNETRAAIFEARQREYEQARPHRLGS